MDFAFLIKGLKEKILSLMKRLKEKDLVIQEAVNYMDEMDARLEALEKENEKLKTLLEKSAGKVVKKTSRNSNLPPSKELEKPKRNKSLREKTGKKPGGQKGHKGHVLEMKERVDKFIPVIPNACHSCGAYLDGGKKVLVDSKQEIDIPPIKPLVYQYDVYEIKCDCGECCRGNFPDRLKGKVQYGSRLRGLISYMSVYQYLPYKRIQIFLEDIFGLHLSQGTIFNSLKRSSKKAEGAYAFLRSYLEQADVVGSDETVIWVNGKKGYNWVWQNKEATFIAYADTRRKDVIYKYFPHGFPKAILISDRYKAHLSTPSKGYQICWAHLIRLINFLIESEESEWIHKLLKLYRRAKKLEALNPEWDREDEKVKQLEADLNVLLLENLDKIKYEETAKLHNSLKVNRHTVFTFLYHKDVPSHNNDSERAIRNAKVKIKISGQFKSGQNYYAIIRSIIDTFIKNDQPIFEKLFQLESGKEISFGFSA